MKRISKLMVGMAALCLMGSAIAMPENICPAVFVKASAEATVPASLTFVGKGSEGDFTCEYYSDGSLRIDGYIGTESVVTIPESVNGKIVRSLNISALSYCSSISDIYISNSVALTGYSNPTNTYSEYTYSEAFTIMYKKGITLHMEGFDIPDVEEVPYTYKKLSNGTIEITEWDKSETEVVIPSEINGIPVTSIGDYAFYGDPFNPPAFKSIKIPDTVTNIGKYAFTYCSHLTSVEIPDNVTNIGDHAFWWCSNLQTVNIPDSLKNIEPWTFCNCDLRSVMIPNGITSIGETAFSGCDYLESVEIPDSVTSIASNAFQGCKELGSINVSENNQVYSSIDGVVYNKDKTKLIIYPTSVYNDKTYILPEGVTRIGDKALYNDALDSIIILNPECEIYDDKYTINDKITIYGCPGSTAQAYAEKYDRKFISIFSYKKYSDYVVITGCNNSICDLVIPTEIDGLPVTSIGNSAFQRYTKLTKVTIPDSVTSIGDSAFTGCTNLTEITIPDSVINIDTDAFVGTPWLKTKQEENPFVIINDILVNGKTCSGDVVIPDNVTNIVDEAFKGCTGITSVTLPDNITNICDKTFSGCTSLKSITIPDNVTSIGNSAFYGCSMLTDITIPNGVTNIGDETFSGCSSLESVIIPDNVTSIGDYVFSGCTSLTSIIIPDNVTSIGNNAFYGCSMLRDITIPSSVTNIGVDAFNRTSWFESKQRENPLVIINNILVDGKTCSGDVIIPEIVTSICPSAFYKCTRLKSITIPNNVTNIGNQAFIGCTSLKSVKIPDNVTSIAAYTFNDCTSLESVKISNALISIGNGAFKGCKNLKSVTIPNDVTSIGDYAFNDCTSLESVKISNALISIGNGAFKGCKNLKSVTIPDNVTSIGEDVFNHCSSLTEITIPNSVTIIGEDAFYYCSSLTEIIIPDSVASIGKNAFDTCSSLSEITILNPECEIYVNSYTIYNKTKIKGYANSTAQTYAEEFNRKFVSLGEAPKTIIRGDANNDKTVDISDAVMLQKWLLGSGTLTSWKNVDLCEDGIIDVFDMIEMRKLIAKK